jgi:hypothetical protein
MILFAHFTSLRFKTVITPPLQKSASLILISE